MKIVRLILTHPVMQLVAFLIIIVGDSDFGGFFGFAILFAVLGMSAPPLGLLWGFFGLVAILVTFVAAFMPGRKQYKWQLVGLAMMLLTLGSYVYYIYPYGGLELWKTKWLAKVTVMLFIAVAATVSINIFTKLSSRS